MSSTGVFVSFPTEGKGPGNNEPKRLAAAVGDLPAQSGSSAKGPGFRRISACLPNEIGRHHADGSGSGSAMIAPCIGVHKQIISYVLAYQS